MISPSCCTFATTHNINVYYKSLPGYFDDIALLWCIWDYLVLYCRAGTLEPTYRQLQTMKLDKSPFVIISVIGQELLAQAKYNAAVLVLESALKIGTCSLKLRGSVFSALSSAYWALNSLDKVNNMHVVCDIIYFSTHLHFCTKICSQKGVAQQLYISLRFLCLFVCLFCL